MKPFDDENGVPGVPARQYAHLHIRTYQWRLLKSLASLGPRQVGSLTVGKLVFGSRSARCGRSQTI